MNARGIKAEATPCAFRTGRQRGVSMALAKMVARSERGEIERPRSSQFNSAPRTQPAG